MPPITTYGQHNSELFADTI